MILEERNCVVFWGKKLWEIRGNFGLWIEPFLGDVIDSTKRI
jgi:hypothetical protein